MVEYCRAAHASSARTDSVARAIPSASIRAVEGRPPAKEMMEGSADTRKSSSRNDTGARESLVAKWYCRILTPHLPDRTDRNIYAQGVIRTSFESDSSGDFFYNNRSINQLYDILFVRKKGRICISPVNAGRFMRSQRLRS